MVPSRPHFGLSIAVYSGLSTLVNGHYTFRFVTWYRGKRPWLIIQARQASLNRAEIPFWLPLFFPIPFRHTPAVAKEPAMTLQKMKSGLISGQAAGMTGGLSEKRVINYTSRYFTIPL